MYHVSSVDTMILLPSRYCEEKFISKYIPTIGVDYGVKPVKFGEYEVGW